MESQKESNEKEKILEQKSSKQSILDNIKSIYILSNILSLLKKNILLKLIIIKIWEY